MLGMWISTSAPQAAIYGRTLQSFILDHIISTQYTSDLLFLFNIIVVYGNRGMQNQMLYEHLEPSATLPIPSTIINVLAVTIQ